MAYTIVCSISSWAKDSGTVRLPARLRYLGDHIKTVECEARKLRVPFFILSGKYGFISGEELIEDYDHLFSFDEIPKMLPVVRKQLKHSGAREIHFYCKKKQNWLPYQSLLRQAAAALQITLVPHELKDD